MEKEALLYSLEEKIAELEKVNNALLSREEELVALNKISVESNPSLDLQETLERTLDVVLSSMGLETGFIFLLNEARGEFVLKAQQGMRGQFARELVTMKAGYDFPAVAPELESLIVVQEISEYPRLGRFLRDREGFHYQAHQWGNPYVDRVGTAQLLSAPELLRCSVRGQEQAR